MGSRTASVAAALANAAVLAAVPAALVYQAGPPHPDLPSASTVQAIIRQPLTSGFILALAHAGVWSIWALLAATTAVRGYRRLAGALRWLPTLHLPGPLQHLTAVMLGATAVSAATGGMPAHAATSPAAASDDTTHPATGSAGHARNLAVQATTSSPEAPATYTVARGDTLSAIAQRCLGDNDRWPEIWKLNKGRHWAHVSGRTAFTDPDRIFPGWVLTLPPNAEPPATTPPSKPPTPQTPRPPTISPTAAPSTAAPTTPPASGPATTPTGGPAATTSSPALGDDGVFIPPETTAAASRSSASAHPALPTTSPSPATARAPDTAAPDTADDTSSHSPGWVEVAGGAMGAGLAAALVYAVTTVWKRRRHRYRPTPITSPVLRDADLTPPLAALTRLRQGVRRAAPHLLDRSPDREPTVGEYIAADVKPPLPPIGPNGADLAGVGALPVTAGLGLDGPAALNAARALLVATLTTGSADDPDTRGRVIIPASTLATLLGVSAVDLNPMHRLTIAPTFAAALALLEEEIIRRSRILADQEAATVFALREEWTFGEPLPQLLLIADVPDDSWHPRLATAIRLGKNVDVGTALIGVWPEGSTLTVAADGTTEGGDGERVAVLDTAATTDILTMLAEVHGDAEPPTTAPVPAPAWTEPATLTRQCGDDPSAEPENLASAAHSADARPEPDAAAADAAEAATDKRVRARVLGEPAILGTDGKPVRGLRAKSLELFVYLVVHRAGASLNDIMEAIWPDVTVSRAADRLSTCVANLRTTIRSVAHTGTGSSNDAPKIEPVINTGGHYHLDPNLLHVDWWTVQDAYAQVATAADDTARLAHLRTAIAATRGGLADGCGYEWIDTDREHARRRLVKIYAQAASLHAESDPAAALALYDTARALDPLSDELARRAMRTAARLGDAAGVRERLTALRCELDDAGIDIDPDTEGLATRLLRDLAHR
ncbi:LysM peptidoglycan-binding domain-containing protein [Micromonospora sp. HUAS YX12]|uniref:LysM peptidoglycan-binding domain-containing protein n=1 Tax=Micromonospora sp. HUAS YX12 TaxID=3156396 RepID=A0AAU7QUF3_9ACTN